MNVRQLGRAAWFMLLTTPPALGFPDAKVDPLVSPLEGLAISRELSTQTQNTEDTFSRKMRAAMQETHDKSKTSVLGDSVAAGKLTAGQYTIALKQNLATFEALRTFVDKSDMPQELKKAFNGDLTLIIDGFREDLGFSSERKLGAGDLLKPTSDIIKFLGTLRSPELAACAYENIGGNAFGTHEVAALAKEKCGVANVKGYTVYTFERFKKLISAMNEAYAGVGEHFGSMVDAAKRFFSLNKKINDDSAFKTP